MANITQEIRPTQDPNYLGYSREISQPRPDTSTGELLKGVADTFSAAVKGADFVTKDNIEEDIRAKYEPIREEYTSGLEDIKTQLAQGKTPTGLNIIGPKSTPEGAPADLEDLGDNITILKNARGAGKLSRSSYDDRVAALAKEYRTAYPGYKDFIDQKIAQLHGGDPANMKIRDLTSDINRMLSGTDDNKKFGDSLIKQATEHGVVDAVTWKVLWDQGKLPLNVLQSEFIKAMKFKTDAERLDAAKKADQIPREIAANRGADILHDMSASSINTYLTAVMTGTLEGVPSNVSATLAQVSQGQAPPAPQVQETIRYMEAYRNTLRDNIYQRAVRDGLVRTIGVKAANEQIDQHMQAYDGFLELLKGGGKYTGAINDASNWMKATTDQDSKNAMKDARVGDYFRKSAVLRKVGGDQGFQALFDAILRDQKFPQVKSWAKDQLMDSVIQPDPNNPKTVTGIIKEGKENGMAQSNPQLVRDVALFPTKIADPQVPDNYKLNMIKAAFGPGNEQLLEHIAEDQYNSKGQLVPGKMFVFHKLTSPEMSKEIARITAGDREAQDMYKTWLETNFRNLYSQRLADMQEVASSDKYKVLWVEDTKTGIKSFVVDPASAPTSKYPSERIRQQAEIDAAAQGARRNAYLLNQGLSSLQNYAKSVPGTNAEDTEAYILQLIQQIGFDPSKANVTTSSEQFNRAMIAGRQKELLIREQKKQQEEERKKFNEGAQ